MKETVVIFAISTVEFAEMQKIVPKKKKKKKMGPKMPYLSILGYKFVKVLL